MREPPGNFGNGMGLPMLDALPREVCLTVWVERISVMIAAAARKIEVVFFFSSSLSTRLCSLSHNDGCDYVNPVDY